MSQVKNLRAMFEQKQDASPPENAPGSDRGRSPVDSAGTATPPPRPLSKVRTNFVAVVEKDGRVGLRRDPSSDSIPTTRSLSQRRLSTNTEEGSASVTSERTSNMALVSEPIPESPRQPEIRTPARYPNGINGDITKLGALSDRPSVNPDKHIDLETPTPKLLPGDPTDIPPPQPLAPAKSSTTNAAGGTPKQTAKASSASYATPKSAASKLPTKLQPVSISKVTSKPPAKSPSLPKTPTSGLPKSVSQPLPTRTHPPKKATERATASKAAAPAAAKSATTKPAASTTTTTAAATKKAHPAPVSVPSSSSTGFVKPKVKSPTRPVNLPSSLMAGTASSQSKVNSGSRESLGPRTSGLGRSPSRASVSTVGAGAAPAKTLRKQRSTINHPRPSLGPPPKKTAQDHPVAKKERDVDEGFLARMARPTLSSASKVSEKAPVTPPRKNVPKKETSTTRASSTATSARKAAAHSAHGATGSPDSKKRSTSVMGAGDDAAEVSKIEEEEVEEALRNATEIPEVAEPAETTHLTPEAPEASKIDEEAPAEAAVEAPSQPEQEDEEAAPEAAPLAPVAEEPKAAEPVPATEDTAVKPEETLVEEAQPDAEDAKDVPSAPTAADVVQDEAVTEDAKEDEDVAVSDAKAIDGTAQVNGAQETEAQPKIE